jgi:hypothetical protein
MKAVLLGAGLLVLLTLIGRAVLRNKKLQASLKENLLANDDDEV